MAAKNKNELISHTWINSSPVCIQSIVCLIASSAGKGYWYHHRLQVDHDIQVKLEDIKKEQAKNTQDVKY